MIQLGQLSLRIAGGHASAAQLPIPSANLDVAHVQIQHPAHSGDLPLLSGWLDAFIEETGIPNPQTGHQIAMTGIDEGPIFVWDDGGAVSMALWNRPTPNGVAINAVFTPGEQRSRGYASSCVAALSQRLLDQGKEFCCL